MDAPEYEHPGRDQRTRPRHSQQAIGPDAAGPVAQRGDQRCVDVEVGGQIVGVGGALRQGAGAILTDCRGAQIAADALAASDAAVVVAEDPRAALAGAAALWFAAQPETIVAVTGTSGKTSVATFTRQIWQALGHKAISLGTMGVQGDYAAKLAHTTPEPVTLHRVLAEAAAAGVTHAAMEASSHGLDQRRLDGVRVRAGAFTNFSQDHLDFHPTMEDYFAAKASLFTPERSRAGVVCVDDAWGRPASSPPAGEGAFLSWRSAAASKMPASATTATLSW